MRPLATLLRPYAFAVLLAVGAALVSLVVAAYFGLPLRDPDGIAGPAYVRLPLIVVLFLAADIAPRLFRRRGTPVRRILRDRLSPARLGVVTAGLLSFYVSYVAYRNLKGALPFARPSLHDDALLRLDEWMAFGHDPALLLHDLLGTGTAAYVLSSVYVGYLLFVPLSLGAALVWGRSVRIGSWYVTALCLNWLLGAVSYYLVPSLGPVFVHPERYADAARDGRLAAAGEPGAGAPRGARRPDGRRRHRRRRRLRVPALLGGLHRRAHGPPRPAAARRARPPCGSSCCSPSRRPPTSAGTT